MKVLLTLALSLMFLSTTAYAVDTSGNYAIWGAGKKSCISYTESAAKGEVDFFNNYMEGFLTAYNIFTEKTYSISGKMYKDQIVEWLTNYCEENPMSSFETALTSFTFDHYDKRMKSSSSMGR